MADDVKMIRLINTRRQPCEIMTGAEVLVLGPGAAVEAPADLLAMPVLAHLIAKRVLRVESLAPPQPAGTPDGDASPATRKPGTRVAAASRKPRKPAAETARKTD